MITPEQIRGARAMLGVTQADLAARAGLSVTGLNNIERGTADPKASSLRAIKLALEAAGALFVGEDVEGPGVRLRKMPETLEDLTRRIEALDAHLAQPEESGPATPARGMKRLENARKRDVANKLRNRRAKLKGEKA